ncbi:hypothetical protein [uncultured Dysosmobacter sp.]|uniref:hypothetical protein n=1 Tax=uncultured Dysosmobacter sp. TaxID=2591384 RepID=UPI0026195151|nr:hypothetical protein [uncultured Dysosmobacter sp.]
MRENCFAQFESAQQLHKSQPFLLKGLAFLCFFAPFLWIEFEAFAVDHKLQTAKNGLPGFAS